MTDDRTNRGKQDLTGTEDSLKARDDESIAGMGGGIAGPSEPGSAGTAGGGTAVGGEASEASQPSSAQQTEVSGAVADALRSASGKPRKAGDELADRDNGSAHGAAP